MTAELNAHPEKLVSIKTFGPGFTKPDYAWRLQSKTTTYKNKRFHAFWEKYETPQLTSRKVEDCYILGGVRLYFYIRPPAEYTY